MKELLDQIKSVEAEHFSEHGMFSQLAAKMKIRDGLCEQQKLHSDERSRYEEPLHELDPDAPIEELVHSLGANALGFYIADKKLEVVRRTLAQIDLWSQLVSTYPVVGSKATVTVTDPERYRLGTSRRNRYGQQEGLSQWHTRRTGIVSKLNLSPIYGGWIELEGRFGRIYGASPLIDRRNEYRLGFSVEPA